MALELEDQDSVCQRPCFPLLPEQDGVKAASCMCSESLGAPFPLNKASTRDSHSGAG